MMASSTNPKSGMMSGIRSMGETPYRRAVTSEMIAPQGVPAGFFIPTLPTPWVHRLLQQLLGLADPFYRHHRLILDDAGQKLSKSTRSTSIRELRQAGLSPADIRHKVGLAPA